MQQLAGLTTESGGHAAFGSVAFIPNDKSKEAVEPKYGETYLKYLRTGDTFTVVGEDTIVWEVGDRTDGGFAIKSSKDLHYWDAKGDTVVKRYENNPY